MSQSSLPFLAMASNSLVPAASPHGGDIIPLRSFNILYEPSPSMSPKSSLPDVADALAQYYNEILGGPPVTLSWKDLKVVASIPAVSSANGDPQVLLHSLSGFAEPFNLVAVLGSQRSGKSTLLKALSGRLSQDTTLEGEIFLNGRRQQLTYGTAAYLTAEDTFCDVLTVQENMYISAVLKLPPSMSMKQKMEIVDQIILDLGLKDCSSKQTGKLHSSKYLTGSERRRLILAMELVMRPRLLYLDEVTDGLDSTAALLYMTKVKLLAREGRTVIACFRDFSQSLFELFDYLLILGNGKNVYFGEACSVAEHFAKSGFCSSAEQNLVSYFLQIQSAEYQDLNSSMKLLQDLEKFDSLAVHNPENIQKTLTTAYETSDICGRMTSKILENCTKKGAVLVHLSSHATFAMQMSTLTYRSFMNIARDIKHYWIRLMLSVLATIMIGTIFFDLDHSTNAIQERASCLFLIYEVLIYITVAAIPFFGFDIKVLQREKLNSYYSSLAFVLANVLSSIPFLLLTSLFCSCSVYFLIGLHPGSLNFAYFLLNLFFSLVVSESLMKVLASLFTSSNIGMMVGSCAQCAFMLVAGYISHGNDIPKLFWTYPLSYISFHHYGLTGLYQNEFLGLEFHHSSSHIHGEQVIRNLYHMDKPNKWHCILILFFMVVFCLLLQFVFITQKERLIESCQKKLLRKWNVINIQKCTVIPNGHGKKFRKWLIKWKIITATK